MVTKDFVSSYLLVPVGAFIPIMLGAVLWAFIHPDLRFVMLLWPLGMIGGLAMMSRKTREAKEYVPHD